MKNLFVAHTPYHIILSTGIASTTAKNDTNVLIIFRDFDLNFIDIENLYSSFQEVIILKGNFDFNFDNNNIFSKIKMFLENKNMINKLKKVIEIYKFEYLYLFNNNKILDKKIIQLTSINKIRKIIYVEDGSASYSSSFFEYSIGDIIKLKLKNLIYNLREYGDIVRVLGEVYYIHSRMFLFPELVRSELKKGTIKEIRSEQLRNGILKTFGKHMNNIPKISDSAIIFLEHYEFVKSLEDKYISMVKDIIEICNNLNKKVYIKYHPRETNYYLSNILSEFNNLHFIEKGIPSEAILLNIKKKSVIISTISTSLITASKLSKNSLKISLLDFLKVNDNNLKLSYEKLGIKLPRNNKEMEEILKRFWN